MFKNLLTKYPHAKINVEAPIYTTDEQYHWFRNPDHSEWIGIPDYEITQNELELLITLFDYHQIDLPIINRSALADKWYQFLFLKGPLPDHDQKLYRISQLSFNGEKLSLPDLELALGGFFSNDPIFLWKSHDHGLIIEPNPVIFETDFLSLSETLESDFFIKPYFFIGKERLLTNDFAKLFYSESQLFELGKKRLPSNRIFTFAELFPYLLIEEVRGESLNRLKQELLNTFKEEPELLHTIKAYLESNFNVTSTAKVLYIHRNTLQYRLDKFVEKTGINLKSFRAAITVYLVCLTHEQN